jgi:hypothetical protein
MTLTERQTKRHDWLNAKISLDYDDSDEYLRVVALHDKLLTAYEGGQDSCASCGALFQVRDFNTFNLCLDCHNARLKENKGKF